MRNDYRGSRPGGRRGFGGGRDRGADRPMFSATCANCGTNCMVPFRPTGDKPVYCSDCFELQSGRESRYSHRDSGVRRFNRRDSGGSRMHQATCDNCGNHCEVPFRPTGEKPVYCNNCFGEGKQSGERNTQYYKVSSAGSQSALEKRLTAIETKLDHILEQLAPATPTEPVTTAEVIEAIIEETQEAPKKKPAKKRTTKAKKTAE